MIDSKLLRSKMVLFGDTTESLAEVLGISRQTLSAKINGKIDFWQSEMKIIIVRYDLTPEETHQMFFN
jgi:DNA-binding XRE family transcriptional regulator